MQTECIAPKPDLPCPEHKVRIQAGGKCYCEAGLVESGDNCVIPKDVCAVKLDENGKCNPPPIEKCDKDELKNAKGECVCKEGYEHKDVAKTICGLIDCKENSYRDPLTGACFCDNGFETDSNGNCATKTCPSGQSLNANNSCVC